MSRPFAVSFCLLSITLLPAQDDESKAAEDVKPPQTIFDASAEGALFATITGDWRKYEDEGNMLIRLQATPVVESRVEMGPYLRNNHVVMSARVLGKSRKHLKPRMGIGLYGKNGFFLWLTPARNRLEIAQHGEVLCDSPYRWNEDQWHHLELTIIGEDGLSRWLISGRAWPEDGERPEKANVEFRVASGDLIFPLAGKAFLCGSPYNGFPLYFDDAVLKKVHLPEPKEPVADETPVPAATSSE